MPSVLVTGAGRGIGEAIALRLASAGWTVLAGVRADSSGDRLAVQDGNITPVQTESSTRSTSAPVHAGQEAPAPDRVAGRRG